MSTTRVRIDPDSPATIETDLLARYAEPAVRDRALQHVLSRLRLSHLNATLAALLDAQLAAFVEDFHGYFPRLQAFAAAERQGCLDGGLQLRKRACFHDSLWPAKPVPGLNGGRGSLADCPAARY